MNINPIRKLSIMFGIFFMVTLIYNYIKAEEFLYLESLLFSVGLLIGAAIFEVGIYTYKKRRKM